MEYIKKIDWFEALVIPVIGILILVIGIVAQALIFFAALCLACLLLGQDISIIENIRYSIWGTIASWIMFIFYVIATNKE